MAKQRRRSPAGGDAFESHYQVLFGSRWAGLRTSLMQSPHRVAFSEGLLRPYYLDEASLFAAASLPLAEGDRVVDFCAAPGGKSLVLARRLPPAATLICNERSASRRARLHRVLDRYLTSDLRLRIRVTAHDATRWGMLRPKSCDRILLDVPCSSERHVIGDPTHLERWSQSRSRHLAIQAFAMLASAIDALADGGTVLYVTCALAPAENDEVIDKAFRKRADCITRLALQLPWGEPTRYGVHVLPDNAAGRGPLYVCLLRKTAQV